MALSTQKYKRWFKRSVVIFFWSSDIMECTCTLFTFENGVPLMRQGASVVWHKSLLLMNSFNKTEAAVFSCRLCFLRAFPFISLILLTTAVVQCLCGGCKKSPRTTSLCSHIVLVLRDHGVYMYVVYICLHLKLVFRSCARGRHWCGIIHYY